MMLGNEDCETDGAVNEFRQQQDICSERLQQKSLNFMLKTVGQLRSVICRREKAKNYNFFYF